MKKELKNIIELMEEGLEKVNQSIFNMIKKMKALKEEKKKEEQQLQ